MEGWIKLHRQITGNPSYFSHEFCRNMAWIDMLILANHKDAFFRVRGIRVEIKRGQIGMTAQNLGVRWKWSKGKVLRFLDELSDDNQIETQKTNVTTLISILNYNEYQGDGTQNVTQNVTQTERKRNANGSANGTQTDLNKNVNNEKNDKNEKNNYLDSTESLTEPELSFEEEKASTEKPKVEVKAKPKKEPKPKKPPTPLAGPSVYPIFSKAYDDFIKDTTGLPARFDGAEGKALKSIIAYLKTVATNKDDEGALTAFQFILKNRARWDNFHQSQLKLTQINSNLINILNSIKNGKLKTEHQANNDRKSDGYQETLEHYRRSQAGTVPANP